MPRTEVDLGLINRRAPEGNIFFIMGITSKALKDSGHKDLADEMAVRVMECHNYEEACQIIKEYVYVEYEN